MKTCLYCGPNCAVGFGNCHCGCGKPTAVATQMKPLLGQIQGVPLRFIQWHIWRMIKPKYSKTLGGDQ